MKQELLNEIKEMLIKNYTEVRTQAENGLWKEIAEKKQQAYHDYRTWSREHNHANNEYMSRECKQLAAYCEYLYKMKNLTDSEIEAKAINDAKAYAENTEIKVRKIVGGITSWENVTLTYGTHYAPMLNGIVEGENGKCAVTTIEKGGYNIMKLHAATLVKRIK